MNREIGPIAWFSIHVGFVKTSLKYIRYFITDVNKCWGIQIIHNFLSTMRKPLTCRPHSTWHSRNIIARPIDNELVASHCPNSLQRSSIWLIKSMWIFWCTIYLSVTGIHLWVFVGATGFICIIYTAFVSNIPYE